MSTASSDIKVLLVGAGALGSVFAWRLQESGRARVTVVCRSNYGAVKEHGFRIESEAYGSGVYRPAAVAGSVADAVADGTVYDYVVVCTKALPNLGDASGDIAPAVASPATAVLLIQNGIGVEEPYHARYPGSPVVSAVAVIDTRQPEAGVIKHGTAAALTMGLYRPEAAGYDVAAATASLEALCAAWSAGGVRAAVTAKIQGVRWSKLIWNASLNPISVLAGGHEVHALLEDAAGRQLVLDVMREAVRIGEAATGEPLPAMNGASGPEAYIEMTLRSPPPVVPSMLMDYWARRPMEHAVILGNPLRVAAEHGISAPRMQTVYALLVLVEKAYSQR
ncbi:hypothetical protein H4R18_003271 [Coemansia javaensis]|uniref:2-dehydropantoate 2-reductase n=1 Tax=Coemansia javaensis TaxID=2761396 RepID=A0A9W8HCL0_9FUNG|nr:hypothetical protein H4R18_003271 [Coemansia javaensis]